MIQNPRKILEPYVKPGMSVLDMGCGTGFFTIPIAEMVGEKGRVVAVDLQEEMLEKLSDKIKDTTMKDRIFLRQCRDDELRLDGPFDFAVLIYVVHEFAQPGLFFLEIVRQLRIGGYMLLSEPKFHVSKEAFDKTLSMLHAYGVEPVQEPLIRFSRTVLLKRTY
jgi:ubiquinone/menaquinone biosynthesis C-methylase UbiE